ncbi:MAG: VWA domain-containing protein [Burkholderiales bacterium]|nr:VWA domain-containing protein [Burkholderiales bacterium]MCE7876424.1 VWA domain-containing protein [Betaproteobacteria bacterium PRO3]
MSFAWPSVLWLLLAVPGLIAVYLWLGRRRKRVSLRYASLAAVREAAGRAPGWKRHVPPVLLLVAIVALVIAAARPGARITLPSDHRTIVLAIDVSLSMRANDIEPSRIEAAQAAAKAFVKAQPGDVRLALVSFAGSAAILQPPTRNRDDLVTAIDRLELQRHTAIGTGILTSLVAIFPEQADELAAANVPSGAMRAFNEAQGRSLDEKPAAPKSAFVPVRPGSNKSAAIILLTDGRRTTGPDPVDAARMAADRGVRVYTVGFGTAEGASVSFDGWSIYMRFDEEALKAIAEVTKATYFHAKSAADLTQVYENLNAQYVFERAHTEISALFVALAAVLTVTAAALSVLWFQRLA